MATQISFDNRIISIPGAYSTIRSGITNPALALAFGNSLIIDTGSSKNSGGFFGGGAGINGTLKQGKDSIYTFDNTRDFRNFIRGGLHWLLAGPLFLPGGGATGGVSSLTYIKAATTVPATINIPFGAQDESDSDADPDNDGDLTIQVRNEGYVGNGVLGDETRALATITITAAGATGNEISVTVQGEDAGTYTVQAGNNIAAVVIGLAAALTANGLVTVVSTNATQIIIRAPRGLAAEINGVSPVIGVTGSVAGSTGAFSGGVEGTKLTRGYAAIVVAGQSEPTKYIVQFWRGTFKGTDEAISTGTPYDGLSELSTKPELIVQSPEISTVQELVTWMQDTTGDGFAFNNFFYLSDYTIGTDADEILPQDLTNNYIKASGGSESYSIDDLNDVLDAISDQNWDFILSDNWGTQARSANNLAILDWITNTAKIKPDLYVAGGSTVGEWNSGSTSSVSLAQAFDTQYVTIVHGGAKVTDIGGRSFKEYKSIYKAADMLGREAGLPPQVPLTFKGLGIQGELHQLTDKEVKLGLTEGVLMSRLDNGSFDIVKGINTLQNNSLLVNPDGTTHSKQLARIIRQLNKEIVVNAKQQLLKKPNGANRNTVAPEDVKAWLEGYLNSKVATNQDDDLILSFQNVEVVINQDAYEVTYGFIPNGEISFLLFTGVLLDA